MAQKLPSCMTASLSAGSRKRRRFRGGSIIPDRAKEKSQEGVVIAVGTGRYDKEQHGSPGNERG